MVDWLNSRWAKKEYHEHTDHLLTIIEEKDRYRQALGFSKEPGVAVNSGGQTVMDICSEIAETLFLMSEFRIFIIQQFLSLQLCNEVGKKSLVQGIRH
jgi:hypothetical protein